MSPPSWRRLAPVLHPTDLDEGGRRALPYALYLAAVAGGELHLVHVTEPGAEGVSGDALPDPGDERDRVGRWLGAIGEGGDGERRELPDVAVRREVRGGEDPAEAILEYRSEIGAGAVCMGTHARRGVRRWVLGSVAEEVVRASPVPVLTAGPDAAAWGDDGLRRIMVPVDLSGRTGAALGWAAVLADAAGAEATGVHVVQSAAGATPSGKRGAFYEAVRAAPGPEVEFGFELLAGDPAERIRGYAAEGGADLVVTASHGRSGASRLALGSVAEEVIRRAPCPVLTVSSSPE